MNHSQELLSIGAERARLKNRMKAQHSQEHHQVCAVEMVGAS